MAETSLLVSLAWPTTARSNGLPDWRQPRSCLTNPEHGMAYPVVGGCIARESMPPESTRASKPFWTRQRVAVYAR